MNKYEYLTNLWGVSCSQAHPSARPAQPTMKSVCSSEFAEAREEASVYLGGRKKTNIICPRFSV